ncbi:MAG: BspA family leucine-rich repeat surface protein [Defluviitaleaceae bacterium]|nr:BspA family leucine-rich repeat surface protein [Defluviitaleaceae bacterium]
MYQRFKKFLCILVIIVMALSVLPVFAQNNGEYDTDDAVTDYSIESSEEISSDAELSYLDIDEYFFCVCVHCLECGCPMEHIGAFAQGGGKPGSMWRLYNCGVLVISGGFLEWEGNPIQWQGGHHPPPWTAHRENVNRIIITGEVTAGAYFEGIFANFTNLTAIEGLSYLNTSNVTSMRALFHNTPSLTGIDLSYFDTSNVVNMGSMFNGAFGLPTIDLSGFDTSNVENMSSMFSGGMFAGGTFVNTGFTSLDLSGFDTGNVTNMTGMFSGAANLSVLDLSYFNTSNVTSMSSMFSGASNLTSLDLSSFDTRNITNPEGFTNIFLNTPSLGQITFGENFHIPDNNFITTALPGVPRNSEFTGRWQNIGTGTASNPQGTHALTSAQLMLAAYSGIRADTWVWQRVITPGLCNDCLEDPCSCPAPNIIPGRINSHNVATAGIYDYVIEIDLANFAGHTPDERAHGSSAGYIVQLDLAGVEGSINWGLHFSLLRSDWDSFPPLRYETIVYNGTPSGLIGSGEQGMSFSQNIEDFEVFIVCVQGTQRAFLHIHYASGMLPANAEGMLHIPIRVAIDADRFNSAADGGLIPTFTATNITRGQEGRIIVPTTQIMHIMAHGVDISTTPLAITAPVVLNPIIITENYVGNIDGDTIITLTAPQGYVWDITMTGIPRPIDDFDLENLRGFYVLSRNGVLANSAFDMPRLFHNIATYEFWVNGEYHQLTIRVPIQRSTFNPLASIPDSLEIHGLGLIPIPGMTAPGNIDIHVAVGYLSQGGVMLTHLTGQHPVVRSWRAHRIRTETRIPAWNSSTGNFEATVSRSSGWSIEINDWDNSPHWGGVGAAPWGLANIELVPDAAFDLVMDDGYPRISAMCNKRLTTNRWNATITVATPPNGGDVGACGYFPCRCDEYSYVSVIRTALEAALPGTEISLSISNGMMRGIPAEVATSVLASLPEIGAVLNSDNTPRSSAAPIGTGTVLEFATGTSLTAVVYGDVTGTGTIEMADVNRVLSHFRGGQALAGAYLAAADINGDGNINLAVVNRIMAYFRGRIPTLRD